MPTITSLKVQKRNKTRINVYLDDEFAFGLTYDVAAMLKIGQTLSPEEITELTQKEIFEQARLAAIRLIEVRPRSVTEISRRLHQKGYEPDVITAVIERLQKVQLLDDVAFAKYWLDQRQTFKPRSQIALRQELQQKGVDRKIIDATLNDLDETAAIRQVAKKQARRYSELPEIEFKQKLGRFLQRRGFSYGIIRPIIDELWTSSNEDN